MYGKGEVKPSGGYRHTLREMRRLVDTGRRSPAIVSRARDLTRNLPDRDGGAEVHAIHNFVRENVRYTRDPFGVETLTDPTDMLLEIDQAGRASEDCDSHVVLEASLLEALGHPTQFATAAMDRSRPGDPSHVYLETRIAGEWVPLDPIVKNQSAGWITPELAGRYGTTVGMGDVVDDVKEEASAFTRGLKWAVRIAVLWGAWRYVVKPIIGR